MRRFTVWLAAVVLPFVALATVAPCRAQTADQLRQQLEEIQRKLESLQQRDAEGGDRKATIIGSSRTRSRTELLAPALVTQIYDLSDLFTVAPPYVARQSSLIGPDEEVFGSDTSGAVLGGSGRGMSGMGGMGGGFFAVPPAPARKERELGQPLHQVMEQGATPGVRTSVEQLIDVIKTTIRPNEWNEEESRIGVIGASLVVTASEEAHTQIAALLDLFRQRWGSLKTVSLRVWWLWLNESELNAALSTATRAKKPHVFGTVREDSWEKLRKASAEGERRGYSAVVTCYNGQTVYTLAGDQRLVVTGLTPAFGGEEQGGGVAYEPTLSTIHDGAALQVTPLATRNGKYVVLDLHSRVNLFDKTAGIPAAGNPAAAIAARAEPIPAGDPRLVTAAIERPTLQSQRIATTLRIPVEQPTLVGGMTFGATKDQNLYLFVEGTIQELRDDDSTAKVLGKPTEEGGAAAAEKPAAKPADKAPAKPVAKEQSP